MKKQQKRVIKGISVAEQDKKNVEFKTFGTGGSFCKQGFLVIF